MTPRQPTPARPGDADPTALGPDDLFLFNEGTHRALGEKMGAHLLGPGGSGDPTTAAPGGSGARFAVWAPNATAVSVIGDFNDWDPARDVLRPLASSGIWCGEVPTARRGHVYKFAITTPDGSTLEKADPFASWSEVPPRTGSVVWDLGYAWGDDRWMARRGSLQGLGDPIAIYEVHLGSWMRDQRDPGRVLGYEEIAPRLIEHVVDLGFTHVELLPVMEHPFYGSWGYQVTGFFAPTARYGTPQGLMTLVDALHQAGIGVIFDWVPSHFPTDAHGLARFDGTHLFEHADPRLGFHPDWHSAIFNYGRHEVRSFLASSADHWLRRYHADGLRVDAVASMLYLDYSRGPGEWVPNVYGGRENLDAVRFLRELNIGLYQDHPDVQTIAEESTAWPGVSRPTDGGGLGFGFKWDMGWMHDTLQFMAEDPLFRRDHVGEATFRAVYAFTENFVLPLSHDEVVHGKGSLLSKMPGDDWQRFANLRLLLAYQWTVPGKKLLFMGNELAPWDEWDHEAGLRWELAGFHRHAGVTRLVGDCNRLYRSEPALHRADADPGGFAWVHVDVASTVMAFLRSDGDGRHALVVCNFTPVPRHDLELGVPVEGWWEEVLNTDGPMYGGGGVGNLGGQQATAAPAHGYPCSLRLTAPPLGCVVMRPVPG